MNEDKAGKSSVPCKICGADTPMMGTRLCDPCWNASHTLAWMSLERVMKIVRSMHGEKAFRKYLEDADLLKSEVKDNGCE